MHIFLCGVLVILNIFVLRQETTYKIKPRMTRWYLSHKQQTISINNWLSWYIFLHLTSITYFNSLTIYCRNICLHCCVRHITFKRLSRDKGKGCKRDSQNGIRDRPFNLQGGIMVFCFVQKIFSDNTRVRIFFFSSEFNIRLYDKNSESH